MIRRAALLAVATLVATTAISACSSPSAESCDSVVVMDEMPEWAGTGFSPGARFPHVFGADDKIVAVEFSYPLVASDRPDPVNKVLLVAREIPDGSAPLTIDARLNGDGDVVHRMREGGPGPGTLDMPLPGCWRMTLHWGDQTDTIDLEYVDTSTAASSAQ